MRCRCCPTGGCCTCPATCCAKRRYRRRATRWASGMLRPATGAIIRNIFDHLSPADSVEPASNRTLPGNPVWGGCERDRQGAGLEPRQLGGDGRRRQRADLARPPESGDLDRTGLRPGALAPGAVRAALSRSPTRATASTRRTRRCRWPTATCCCSTTAPGGRYAEGSQYSRALELELDLQRMVARRVRESGRRCTPRAAPACSACPTATTATPLNPVYGSSRAERCCREFIIIVRGPPDGRTAYRDPEFR